MSDRPNPQFDNHVETQTQKSEGILTQFSIHDKTGDPYNVDYFTFPKDAVAMNDPRLSNYFFDAMRIARRVFPYGDRAMDRVVNKFNNAQALDVITTPERKVVGFHVYNFSEIAIEESKAKVMYTEYAAIAPEYQRKGLTTQARIPVIEKEDPDILCGTTGNAAVYQMNSRVASEMGYVLYPSDDQTPHKISEIAHIIGSRFGITQDGRLDNRLVLTYPGKASRGTTSHPLFDEVLHLSENQHLFYVAMKEAIQASLLK